MKEKFDVIIIENDIKSLKLLSYYIKEYCQNLHIVATIDNVNDGILSIRKNKPDIIFIDIVLNDGLGFELLDNIDYSLFQIIFISGFEKHAVNAFKYNPTNYLLKPFRIKDLQDSVHKAVKKIEANLAMTTQKEENKDYIALSSEQKIIIVKIEDILFCESKGNYTVFHLTNSKKIMPLKNIGAFEKILPKNYFFRIHKKYIVNFSHIKSIHRSNGFYCLLSNGSILSVSRRKQKELRNKLHKEYMI